MEISTLRSRRASDRSAWRSIATWLAVVSALWPSTASADAAGQAEALFVEAKRLMAEGRYAEACPKLETSQRLDPGGGTLVALALCLENEGRVAKAAASYREALEVAVADGNENRAKVARARLAALQPRLSFLVVEVAPALASLPNLEITIDGAPLAPPWGEHAVDRGVHRVEARVPGRTPFVAEREVRAEGARVLLRIDSLAEMPDGRSQTNAAGTSAVPPRARPAAVVDPDRRSAPSSALRSAGWITAGAGLVLVGIGAGLGIKALSDDAAADERCSTVRCDDQAAVESSRDAVAAGNAATVLVAVGAGALVAGGVLLWMGAGSDGAGRAHVALAPRGAGGVVSGSF